MTAVTPYRACAAMYFDAGWSPIPIPFREKSPVPLGFTGVDGVYVTETQMKAWCRPKARITVGNFNYPPGNIALRLPHNVLGIDVDAYGEKAGDATLTAAVADWGPLPPTWVSTSKSDGLSGIRFFRIPEGLSWPGELPQGKGVELLRWDHRFAIVYPSLHDKTGAEYGWHLQDDSLRLVASPEDFPSVGDLAELPQEWVEGLTGGTAWEARAVNAEMSEAEAASWLASCVDPDGEACGAMGRTLTSFEREVRQAGDDGGAHDTARNGVWALLGDARSGHSGINTALTALRKVFLGNANRESRRVAESEWKRFVFRGIAKVSNEADVGGDDPCDFRIGLEPSTSAIFQFDEFGNAERLARVMAGRARWVPGIEKWYVWDTVRWAVDEDGQVARWAWKAIEAIDKEIASLGGTATEEDITTFKKHQKSSKKLAALSSMVGLVKNRTGITISAGTFDAKQDLLNCPNGTVQLTGSGVEFIRAQRSEDYLTKLAGSPYLPDATSAYWDKFLARFIPDEECRLWVQKLVGYSLLGRNQQRLFIVVYGPTSTGKTTFAETIRTALGEYSATVNLSIFRDNQDERSRPDLVRALRKRIIFAEEASSEWHLHPDQIKRLTGGSEISARLPHKGEYLEAVPSFTPWLLTNASPSIKGADNALWRRIRVIPFLQQIPQQEEIAEFNERLGEEKARAAVLAWALAGWEAYCEDSDLEQPASTWPHLADFQQGVSELDTCIGEICETGGEFYEQASVLYEGYRIWCEQNGVKHPEGSIAFSKFLKGRFDKKSKRIDGKVQTPYVGVRLRGHIRKLVIHAS